MEGKKRREGDEEIEEIEGGVEDEGKIKKVKDGVRTSKTEEKREMETRNGEERRG